MKLSSRHRIRNTEAQHATSRSQGSPQLIVPRSLIRVIYRAVCLLLTVNWYSYSSRLRCSTSTGYHLDFDKAPEHLSRWSVSDNI